MPEDCSVGAEIRQLLARFACRKATRKLGWPRDWAPTSVRNPRGSYGEPFTEAGAWEFIAERISEGHPIEVIALDTPSGRTGYVMIIALPADLPLYVKLQLGSGVIIGRSFHYSKKG